MSDGQNLAFSTWRQSAAKLDYFLTGLIAAVFAYVARGLEPRKFDVVFTSYYLEVAAVVLLLGSLGVALKRLENMMWVDLTSFDRIKKEGYRDALREAATKGGIVSAGEHSFGPRDAAMLLEGIKPIIDETQFYQDKAQRKAQRTAKWRNRLLFCGFVLLVVARVTRPYYP